MLDIIYSISSHTRLFVFSVDDIKSKSSWCFDSK